MLADMDKDLVKPTQPAGLQHAAGLLDGGMKPVHVSNPRHPLCLTLRRDQLFRLFQVQAQRFFNEQMAPVPEGFQGEGDMQMGRRADDGAVKGTVLPRFGQSVENGDAELPAEFLAQNRVGVANGDRYAGYFLKTTEMPLTDAAAADDEYRSVQTANRVETKSYPRICSKN
jgi:hypothetical protein